MFLFILLSGAVQASDIPPFSSFLPPSVNTLDTSCDIALPSGPILAGLTLHNNQFSVEGTNETMLLLNECCSPKAFLFLFDAVSFSSKRTKFSTQSSMSLAILINHSVLNIFGSIIYLADPTQSLVALSQSACEFNSISLQVDQQHPPTNFEALCVAYDINSTFSCFAIDFSVFHPQSTFFYMNHLHHPSPDIKFQTEELLSSGHEKQFYASPHMPNADIVFSIRSLALTDIRGPVLGINQTDQIATFVDCSFTNISGSANGGVIFAAKGHIFVANCSFVNCESSGLGGAICCVKASVEITQCFFAGNRANFGNDLFLTHETTNDLLAQTRNITNCESTNDSTIFLGIPINKTISFSNFANITIEQNISSTSNSVPNSVTKDITSGGSTDPSCGFTDFTKCASIAAAIQNFPNDLILRMDDSEVFSLQNLPVQNKSVTLTLLGNSGSVKISTLTASESTTLLTSKLTTMTSPLPCNLDSTAVFVDSGSLTVSLLTLTHIETTNAGSFVAIAGQGTCKLSQCVISSSASEVFSTGPMIAALTDSTVTIFQTNVGPYFSATPFLVGVDASKIELSQTTFALMNFSHSEGGVFNVRLDSSRTNSRLLVSSCTFLKISLSGTNSKGGVGYARLVGDILWTIETTHFFP
ncbi:hypothetical protein BLNAU_16099 [Blattamonas nauphoetae]|uniref:Uncharacterized protein n=1 Tax=Blattamonas nauphoetae TaxID=2049346 RepID=A0ABQ9XCK7_9EUKA|nr:hypothetical protein BLNAU_16099 [Blattamonas nauphoetae]